MCCACLCIPRAVADSVDSVLGALMLVHAHIRASRAYIPWLEHTRIMPVCFAHFACKCGFAQSVASVRQHHFATDVAFLMCVFLVRQVLQVAGFTPEESRSIFNEVDTDGGGSVSLAEFEKWWIETQRQQVRRSAARTCAWFSGTAIMWRKECVAAFCVACPCLIQSLVPLGPAVPPICSCRTLLTSDAQWQGYRHIRSPSPFCHHSQRPAPASVLSPRADVLDCLY